MTLQFSPTSTTAILLTTSTLLLYLTLTRQRTPPHTSITSIPSPLHDPASKQPFSAAYPPDRFPGARDVPTPYGSLRTYEWGPEDGRKVLLVHGISTPCLSVGGLAEELVRKGCRVMIFDLPGRGFSSTPAPHLTPHTAAFYSTAILYALTSSPLSWTGRQAFDLVGYSLGGGIGMSFAAALPGLLRSIVLVAPSGLIREKHIAWSSRVLYRTEGILPVALVRRAVRRRVLAGVSALEGGKMAHGSGGVSSGAAAAPPSRGAEEVTEAKINPEAAAGAELGAGSAPVAGENSPVLHLARAVKWQVEQHAGFLDAFVSAIRHAPITGRHEEWAKVRGYVENGGEAGDSLIPGKILMVLGRTDPVIVRDEVQADGVEVLGERNVQVEVLEGAHDVPIAMPDEVVKAVWKFWGLEG